MKLIDIHKVLVKHYGVLPEMADRIAVRLTNHTDMTQFKRHSRVMLTIKKVGNDDYTIISEMAKVISGVVSVDVPDKRTKTGMRADKERRYYIVEEGNEKRNILAEFVSVKELPYLWNEHFAKMWAAGWNAAHTYRDGK